MIDTAELRKLAEATISSLRQLAEAAKYEGQYAYASGLLALLSERDRLAAENARLRAMLQRAADIHDGPGDFCIDGRLEDGSPCPSCQLNKEIREALAPREDQP